MEKEIGDALGIKFEFTVEMNLGSTYMFSVHDEDGQKNIHDIWSIFVKEMLRKYRGRRDVRKISVSVKDDEYAVVEVPKELHEDQKTILLLPKEEKPMEKGEEESSRGKEKSKKGKEKSKRSREAEKEKEDNNTPKPYKEGKEILVIILCDGWDKPLLLGLDYHDLYLKWFQGKGSRYVFHNVIDHRANTKSLSKGCSYQEMLGIDIKTTGKLKFTARNFVLCLSNMFDSGDEEPRSASVAYIILYMIEAVRFRAVHEMGFDLFRLHMTDQGHKLDSQLIKLVNSWSLCSSQIFKEEKFVKDSPSSPGKKTEETDPFYGILHPFCDTLSVKKKTEIYKILAVALGPDVLQA